MDEGAGELLADAPGQIWADDLLGRRADAELLAGYIESLLRRPGSARTEHAYTIALDAGYGEGKSFFLNRLARHLALNHPVAYIDAWADDVADQPLAAIAATLKTALTPLFGHSVVRDEWAEFIQKSSKIAKIAGIGLLKRGLGLLITHGGSEAVAGVLSHAGEDVKDAATDAIRDGTDDAIDDIAQELGQLGKMDHRIKEFHDAKEAMEDMKHSLRRLVHVLDKLELHAPIVIIVDELDRCRPPYAIKLLEQIKHLFDVPGIVFILGLQGDQLAHSIAGAYGPSFDGKAYLRRFINRRYSLSPPDHKPLLTHLLSKAGLTRNSFEYPTAIKIDGRPANDSLPLVLHYYGKLFNLSARDLIQLCDMLETAAAVAHPSPLILPYFVPLLIGHMKGLSAGDAPDFQPGVDFKFYVQRDNAEITPATLFGHLKSFALLSQHALSQRNSNGYAFDAVADLTFQSDSGALGSPRNYPRLLSAVSRFNPA